MQFRTRLLFGNGVRRELGALAGELGARRILVVTDAGLVRAGHAAAILEILRGPGRDVRLFDEVRENPDTESVGDCLAVARGFRPDLFVGLGGGSAMDTAKGCNFLLTNGGSMHDYRGIGRASRPMLPLLAVPTTAGTGSECQSAALIADAKTHMKMACLDPKAAARVAVLDPELTVSLPASITACTGIDAIAHAVETAVTTRRSPVSTMYSREAFRLLAPSLPVVMRDPGDRLARGRMLLGSALAGTAIELSMLGAAHAAANPLTARFGLAHGVAVGLMLPAVVRFNAAVPAVSDAYSELTDALQPSEGCDNRGAHRLVRTLECLLDAARMPLSLVEVGIQAGHLPELADEAAKQWTAGFNPRSLCANEFRNLYESALIPRGADSRAS